MTRKEKSEAVMNTPEFAARMMAVQAVYQISQNRQPLRDVIEEFVAYRRDVRLEDGQSLGQADAALFKKIMIWYDQRLAQIDEILKANKKRDVEPLLAAVLLCGITEILCHTDEDAALIINDYLNITHGFYPQGQVSLVNGILDSVAKIIRS